MNTQITQKKIQPYMQVKNSVEKDIHKLLHPDYEEEHRKKKSINILKTVFDK